MQKKIIQLTTEEYTKYRILAKFLDKTAVLEIIDIIKRKLGKPDDINELLYTDPRLDCMKDADLSKAQKHLVNCFRSNKSLLRKHLPNGFGVVETFEFVRFIIYRYYLNCPITLK